MIDLTWFQWQHAALLLAIGTLVMVEGLLLEMEWMAMAGGLMVIVFGSMV